MRVRLLAQTWCVVLLLQQSGCAGGRIYQDGDKALDPMVKWVFQSGNRIEWFGIVPFMMRESIDDAGLFDERLVMLTCSGGGMLRSTMERLYVVDTRTGELVFTVRRARGEIVWRVVGDELQVGEKNDTRAYRLSDGRAVMAAGQGAERTSSLTVLPYEEVFHEKGPWNLSEHRWTYPIADEQRLVQAIHPDSERYRLFLEHVGPGKQARRRELVALRRGFAAARVWAGKDAAGDTVMALQNGFSLCLKNAQSGADDAIGVPLGNNGS